jgi:DNA-directed RNA polymerase specialized sigma24 family protein
MSRSYDDEYVEFADAALPKLRRTAYLVCTDPHRADEVAQQALVQPGSPPLTTSTPSITRSG